MTKRMLIDASHAEETRVVVLDGNRLEDFDVETATKRQLKGNIYLAKIVRVEPSLQAAFVEYGGNRHGFLAFGEIHPDYYQIPVADRQRLIAAQEAEEQEDEEDHDEVPERQPERTSERRNERRPDHRRGRRGERNAAADPASGADMPATADGPFVPREPAEYGTTEDAASSAADLMGDAPSEPQHPAEHETSEDGSRSAAELIGQATQPPAAQSLAIDSDGISAELGPDQVETDPAGTTELDGPSANSAELFPADDTGVDEPGVDDAGVDDAGVDEPAADEMPADTSEPGGLEGGEAAADDASAEDAVADDDRPAPESMGGETEPRERRTPRFLRNYKIQEVIRRRQILLIQVVKEERGSKGAALTTYISLAGRYSVLMPNSPRGGGISRKITSAADRRRLKEVTQELQLPRGMGMIVRTAGAARPKAEILRDGEYLLNQWDQIRELTMKSVSPALIYEEANLIKRTIRDVYSRDVDEVLVDGEAGWRNARDFMRMLMPAHARKVQLWREGQPLFAKMQVEAQLDGMLQPTVQLRSGGYLVINQTEALVAIDVNSGRSTRERGIEETALRTNMEAAAEVARQLRLRDLAGLIVIDFIDMEQRRHNAMVERELKEALRQDRARIQVGSISHFGLMEMSRQRLRPSLAETAFVPCVHCGGTGHVRGTESAALYVLRAVEEEGAKRRAAEIVVHVAGTIAMYVLNHKRARLSEIEARYGMLVSFAADESLRAPEVRIERVRTQTAQDGPLPVSPGIAQAPDTRFAVMEAADALLEEAPDETDAVADAEREDAPAEAAPAAEAAAATTGEGGRRRRRRRGGRRDDAAAGEAGSDGVGDEASDVGGADNAVAADAMAGDVTATGGDGEVAPEETVVAAPAAAADGTPPAEAAGEGAAGEGAEGEKRRGRRGGRRRRRPAGSEAPEGESTGEPDADGTDPTVAVSNGAGPARVQPARVQPARSQAARPQPARGQPSRVEQDRGEQNRGEQNRGEPGWSGSTWTGPTPADPFGGRTFDIFDAMEAAEARYASAAAPAVTAEAASPSNVADATPEAVALAASEPATSESVMSEPVMSEPATSETVMSETGSFGPTGQSSMPDLEPVPVPPAAPEPDLPVSEPLPWTTPDVTPPEEPAEAAAPEAASDAVPDAEREPELSLTPTDPAEPAVKRRGWWRR